MAWCMLCILTFFSSMYTYICTYIYVCIYIHTYVCLYTCVFEGKLVLYIDAWSHLIYYLFLPFYNSYFYLLWKPRYQKKSQKVFSQDFFYTPGSWYSKDLFKSLIFSTLCSCSSTDLSIGFLYLWGQLLFLLQYILSHAN